MGNFLLLENCFLITQTANRDNQKAIANNNRALKMAKRKEKEGNW